MTTHVETDALQTLEGDIAKTRDQLFLYAEDMKNLVNGQRKQLAERTASREQITAYTEWLETAFSAEKRLSRELERVHYETAMALTQMAECLWDEHPAHLEKIGRLSAFLAAELGASEKDASTLLAAAPLLDVGKIGVPDTYLTKPGPLDRSEWEVMKSHTILGGKILAGSSSPLIQAGRTIALTHHERWDGTGYPRGFRRGTSRCSATSSRWWIGTMR